MMKYTNMKQIGCLICVAVFLVCAIGCSSERYVRNSCHTHFMVDGKIYSLEAHTEVDRRGKRWTAKTGRGNKL